MRALIVLLSSMLLAAFADAATLTRVTVDPTHSLDIGGTEIKPTLFGVTAFEGFPRAVWDADFRARLAACRFGAIRFPACIAWCSPDHDDLAWYDTPAAMAMLRDRPLFGDRYVYARFLPIVRAWTAQPIPCLCAPPKWMQSDSILHLPKDWKLWGRYCAAYLKLWRKFDPDLKYFQVWNEPNANFWKDKELCDKHGGQAGLYADFFNATVKAVKRVHPDLKSLGPVLCWPPAWPRNQKGKKPWYTFDEFTIPFIERTKNTTDYFDFHAYDVPPDQFIVQVSMLFAKSEEIRKGRPLLSWITESNYSVQCKPEDWKDLQYEWTHRAIPYERYLLTLLDNQDMIEGNLYHDIQGGKRWTLFNTNDQATGAYGVFWILRNLRGRRVVAESTDSALRAFAAAERERLTIILFNDSNSDKHVQIKGTKPNMYCAFRGAQALLPPKSPGSSPPRIAWKAKAKIDRLSFTIETTVLAQATVALYLYPIPSFPQKRVTTVRQFFAQPVLQLLPEDRPKATLRVRLPDSLFQGKTSLSLRVGLLAPEAKERFSVNINGQETAIRSVPLQEIDSGRSLKAGDNVIVVSCKAKEKNRARAVGFVSVVARTTK